LEKQKVLRSALRDDIAALSLEVLFRRMRGNTSRSNLWAFFANDLPAALKSEATFTVKLETNSNLWPQLLKEHCDSVSLSVGSIDLEWAKLRTLVARRNDIAHGKPNVVTDLAEYAKYEEAVSSVMYELALAIALAVHDRQYLVARQGAA
jgi:hypothetical protein